MPTTLPLTWIIGTVGDPNVDPGGPADCRMEGRSPASARTVATYARWPRPVGGDGSVPLPVPLWDARGPACRAGTANGDRLGIGPWDGAAVVRVVGLETHVRLPWAGRGDLGLG